MGDKGSSVPPQLNIQLPGGININDPWVIEDVYRSWFDQADAGACSSYGLR